MVKNTTTSSATAAKRSAEQPVIERLLQELEQVVPLDRLDQAKQFLSLFYRNTALKDLQASSARDLIGAALAHWQLGATRLHDQVLVRVYNPDPERDGWQSGHTIVEVVSGDKPFLIKSLKLALQRMNLTVHLTVHPVINIERDDQGAYQRADVAAQTESNEAWMHLQIDRRTADDELANIKQELIQILNEVCAATGDWKKMQSLADQASQTLSKSKSPNPELQTEAAEFVAWLTQSHFTFLGYCEFDLSAATITANQDSALGVLALAESDNLSILPGDAAKLNPVDFPVLISKSNRRASVHRDVKMDLIAIAKTDSKNNLIGWQCFVGLFTASTYRKVSAEIPLLRRHAGQAQAISGLDPTSHDGKTFRDIIETFPLDLLMQSQPEELRELATGILNLQERQRVALFGQADLFCRFYNCLVYVPREKYGRELRLAVQDILTEALQGYEVEFDSDFSSTSALARISYVIWTQSEAKKDDINWQEIEDKLTDVAHNWEDHLQRNLLDHYGEEQGNTLINRYAGGFDAAYREAFRPAATVYDIERMESIADNGELAMRFFRPPLAEPSFVHFKLYSPAARIELSNVLPIIENMGLHVVGEQPFKIKRSDGKRFFLHEFTLRSVDGQHIDPDSVAEQFTLSFEKSWLGLIENDSLNQLVIKTDLSWRDITVLRAISKYMQQIGSPFSQQYISSSLCSNTAIVEKLIALFHHRFDPALQPSSDKVGLIQEQITHLLDSVNSLDEDRILRIICNLIQAMLRTNHFQRDTNGSYKPYLSFKLDPAKIEAMPLPRPMFEISVYSPEVEGIHLRGGKVARGGLRWSDRREDFRTEILGLVKAQMVKNSVIVPVGSKGGFVIKNPVSNTDREAFMAQGIACYKTFLRGLLDLTDNRVAGEIVPPIDVVRYDEDDPYLVVAADKGTATFSDFANSVSAEYGFWLGDAFASGGSNGYDHKAMGITARGAWESVKRHFREIDIDVQSQDFTVVGVGDMAGDVFGNGMLLSEHIQLVAAFNHLHIFIDPTPNSATSFGERQRLFAQPRSSWTDYDSSLISKGGGIFNRSAKSIPLSAQARKALNIDSASLPPNELINAILKAPVDLFWNGGIGTYIKASSQSQAEAADRANDSVRVDGNQLRCKVIGEGGNLGATQLGRIEFASRHQIDDVVALNYTDAIDNSAGVDCSDHEVNIKILLDQVVEQGELTQKQRDTTLAAMTDEVALLVLDDNYQQTQCINLAAYQAPALLAEHSLFISDLESADLLNRAIEYLPDLEQINERANLERGLTRPELSVIVSYAKMTIYSALLATDVPDDPYFSKLLSDYFPSLLREKFAHQMADHQLRREIIATVLTNNFVNRLGPSFAMRMRNEIGAGVGELFRAFAVSIELFKMHDLWTEIEGLDCKVPAQTQTELSILVRGLVERSIHWLVRARCASASISETIARFQSDISALTDSLPTPLAAINLQSHELRSAVFINQGVDPALAIKAANVIPLSSAFDLSEVASTTKCDMVTTAGVYFEIGARLDLQWLRDSISELQVKNHWHGLAKARLRAEMHNQQKKLCIDALSSLGNDSKEPMQIVAHWSNAVTEQLVNFENLMAELKSANSVDFAMLSVAINEVSTLISKG